MRYRGNTFEIKGEIQGRNSGKYRGDAGEIQWEIQGEIPGR